MLRAMFLMFQMTQKSLILFLFQTQHRFFFSSLIGWQILSEALNIELFKLIFFVRSFSLCRHFAIHSNDRIRFTIYCYRLSTNSFPSSSCSRRVLFFALQYTHEYIFCVDSLFGILYFSNSAHIESVTCRIPFPMNCVQRQWQQHPTCSTFHAQKI